MGEERNGRQLAERRLRPVQPEGGRRMARLLHVHHRVPGPRRRLLYFRLYAGQSYERLGH